MAGKTFARNTAVLPDFDFWQVLAQFSAHLSIAHQIGGRVRLKLAKEALNEFDLDGLNTERLRATVASLRGIKAIRLNLLARSCLVEYDNRVIPDAAWPDLLAGRKTTAAAALIGILQEKYEDLRHGKL